MSAGYIQANTNGRLHSAHEPSLSPLNRGFLYGDAIYEVWRTHHGVVFAWREHFARLLESARALHLEVPFAPEELFREIRRTVAAFRGVTGHPGDVYIRLQWARGAGPIGLDPALASAPEWVVLVQPLLPVPAAARQAGLRLAIATTIRRNPRASLSPAWKTGNYLNNILGLHEARQRGADEVLLLNLAGEITESAVSNVGFVRRGEVVTPPLTAGILAGITRGLILGPVAAAAGCPAREETVRPETLGEMEECFLMSTTKDVQPVAAVDGRGFSVGPGTVALRLQAAFAEYARAYARRHPELAV